MLWLLLPKEGRNLRNLVSENLALIDRRLLCFQLDTSSLRHQVIQCKYGLENSGMPARRMTHVSDFGKIIGIETILSPVLSGVRPLSLVHNSPVLFCSN